MYYHPCYNGGLLHLMCVHKWRQRERERRGPHEAVVHVAPKGGRKEGSIWRWRINKRQKSRPSQYTADNGWTNGKKEKRKRVCAYIAVVVEREKKVPKRHKLCLMRSATSIKVDSPIPPWTTTTTVLFQKSHKTPQQCLCFSFRNPFIPLADRSIESGREKSNIDSPRAFFVLKSLSLWFSEEKFPLPASDRTTQKGGQIARAGGRTIYISEETAGI